MTNEEKIVGRIKAILYASETVIAEAKPRGLRDTVMSAKELAYDQILGVVEDPAWCPWQE